MLIASSTEMIVKISLSLSPQCFINPLKTSPEYTQGGVYRKCVL